MEEELLGLWYRYHAYDGTDMYLRFDANRSACKWEEPGGTEPRKSRTYYSHWEVDDANAVGEAEFRIIVQYVGGGENEFVFASGLDEVWPSGADMLRYHPSGAGKVCE